VQVAAPECADLLARTRAFFHRAGGVTSFDPNS
jgi:hypothetical protein